MNKVVLKSMCSFISEQESLKDVRRDEKYARVLRYLAFLGTPMSIEILIGPDEVRLFNGFKVETPEDHKIENLNGTTFISFGNLVVADKKDWEDDYEFFIDTIESLANDSDLGDDLELSDLAVKLIFGEDV